MKTAIAEPSLNTATRVLIPMGVRKLTCGEGGSPLEWRVEYQTDMPRSLPVATGTLSVSPNPGPGSDLRPLPDLPLQGHALGFLYTCKLVI
jgi:hypothetical protein